LGGGGLDAVFSAFMLDRDPELEIDTTTTPDEPLADPLLAGIGQDNLSVTPLKIGLAMAALAWRGSIPQPQLATANMDEAGQWQELAQKTDVTQAISETTAREIRRAFALEDGIQDFSTLVISGPQGSTNAWYVGMSDTETVDRIVVVVLEGTAGELTAQSIGRGLLRSNQ
jgi:cell division protein FtsI/penicillin-binding protein 2